MKRLILLFSILLSGCDPNIRCWYATSHLQSVGAPYFGLRGRTIGFLTSDVHGPMFQTQAELEQYIRTNSLVMCGKSQ
jgi:hypothetical protein